MKLFPPLMIAAASIAVVIYTFHTWASQPCYEVIFNPETNQYVDVECNV